MKEAKNIRTQKQEFKRTQKANSISGKVLTNFINYERICVMSLLVGSDKEKLQKVLVSISITISLIG